MRHSILTLLLSFAAAALVLSCEKKEETPNTSDTPGGTPSISITEQGNFSIAFDAASSSVHYTVTNPVEGGKVIPEASADWITELDTSVEGTVTILTEENTDTVSRNAILTLRYEYEGCEEDIKAQINLIQEACPYTYIKELPLTYGYYYGTRTGSVPNYYLSLAENPMVNNAIGDGYTYILDIYSTEPGNMNAIAPAAGTYKLGNEFDAWTFNSQNSSVRIKTAEGTSSISFTDGTITVTQEGDQYTYEAILTDSNKDVHYITYTGPVSLRDFSQGSYVSTLSEDHKADMTGATCSAHYYGDTYVNASGIPTSNWQIFLSTLPNGDHFTLDICAPPTSTMETGIAPGTYTLLNCNYGVNTALQGFITGGAKMGSWFHTYKNAAQTDPIAPLDSGNIIISRDGETYTINIQAWDDQPQPKAITATWTGRIELKNMDYE